MRQLILLGLQASGIFWWGRHLFPFLVLNWVCWGQNNKDDRQACHGLIRCGLFTVTCDPRECGVWTSLIATLSVGGSLFCHSCGSWRTLGRQQEVPQKWQGNGRGAFSPLRATSGSRLILMVIASGDTDNVGVLVRAFLLPPFHQSSLSVVFPCSDFCVLLLLRVAGKDSTVVT